MNMMMKMRGSRKSHIVPPLAIFQLLVVALFVLAAGGGVYNLTVVENGTSNTTLPIFATTNTVGTVNYITNYLSVNVSITNALTFTIAPTSQLTNQVIWNFTGGTIPASVTNLAPSSDNTYSAMVTLDTNNFPTNVTPVTITSHRTDDNGVICPTVQTVVNLLPSELAVDANRDGTIVLPEEAKNPANIDPTTGNALPLDTTSQANPFRFWINNDQDNGAPDPDTTPYASEVVPAMAGTPNEGPLPDVESRDCDANYIVSMRDLEDWTRLWIYTKGFNQAIHDAHILVGLKWKQVTRGIPGIKIVQATDSDGGTEYLTDSTFAAASAQATTNGTSPRVLIQTSGPGTDYLISASASDDPNRAADFVFPSTTWTNLTDAAPKTFFLFEGASEGEGELEIVF